MNFNKNFKRLYLGSGASAGCLSGDLKIHISGPRSTFLGRFSLEMISSGRPGLLNMFCSDFEGKIFSSIFWGSGGVLTLGAHFTQN